MTTDNTITSSYNTVYTTTSTSAISNWGTSTGQLYYNTSASDIFTINDYKTVDNGWTSDYINYKNLLDGYLGHIKVGADGTVYYETTEKQDKEIEEALNKKITKKENKFMENFGAYTGGSLRLSMYGIAVKNKAGKWVSYNTQTGRLIDVDILNIEIDSSKIFFKIPKAIKDVAIGDIILHNSYPMFVEEIKDEKFTVINPYEGTEVTILPTVSPFGYDYVTVITSLTSFLPEANKDNPFGNLLPFMLMDKDNKNLGLLLALSGNLKDIDPMMLMFMGNENLAMMMMFQQMNEMSKKTEFDKQMEKLRQTPEYKNGRVEFEGK